MKLRPGHVSTGRSFTSSSTPLKAMTSPPSLGMIDSLAITAAA
ncbi:hypothetical protein ACFW9N_22355 [Streptomyces sp. NPDC059496]